MPPSKIGIISKNGSIAIVTCVITTGSLSTFITMGPDVIMRKKHLRGAGASTLSPVEAKLATPAAGSRASCSCDDAAASPDAQ
jgi:hypothetical protein